MGETRELIVRPVRVQLSRMKGWRMPANTLKVDRTSQWGNPFRVGDSAQASAEAPTAICFSQAEAVDAYRALIRSHNMMRFRNLVRTELGGKNLACWCRLGTPCHADVLLECASEPEEVRALEAEGRSSK